MKFRGEFLLNYYLLRRKRDDDVALLLTGPTYMERGEIGKLVSFPPTDRLYQISVPSQNREQPRDPAGFSSYRNQYGMAEARNNFHWLQSILFYTVASGKGRFLNEIKNVSDAPSFRRQMFALLVFHAALEINYKFARDQPTAIKRERERERISIKAKFKHCTMYVYIT